MPVRQRQNHTNFCGNKLTLWLTNAEEGKIQGRTNVAEVGVALWLAVVAERLWHREGVTADKTKLILFGPILGTEKDISSQVQLWIR